MGWRRPAAVPSINPVVRHAPVRLTCDEAGHIFEHF
jgi:hypothetical protein